MKLGQVFSVALAAGVEKILPGGRFIRLLTADADVTVSLYTAEGSPLGDFAGVRGGFGFGVKSSEIGKENQLVGWGKTGLTSATNQTVVVVVSRQPIDYDRLAGSISATITQGETITAGSGSVNAADTELVPSNANCKALTVRNTHASLILYVTGGGEAADATKYPLNPGESHTFTGAAASSVRGFGSGAATTYAWISEAKLT